MPSSFARAGLLVLVCSAVSAPAWSDSLQPYVGVQVDHEDNLFRLGDDQLRQTDISSDTYRTVTAGVKIAPVISRQLFSFRAALASVTYERNSQLDYVAKDLGGEWHWFVAAHFDGHIGGSYTETLAPFSDFDTVQRNLRVTNRKYVDGSWRFHPSFRWVTSYTKDLYSYGLLSQRGNDRTEDALTSGVDFLAPSGSTIGVQVRQLKGGYPGQTVAVGTFGNDFVQNEAKINILWLTTGTTQVLFLGGWAQRKLKLDADRVVSGTNARLIVNYMPVGRLKFTGQAWREFAAIDGAAVDSALSTGVSGQATWDFSAKIQAVADTRHEVREFKPFSGADPALVTGSSSDSSTRSTVGLVYRPMRNLSVRLSAFREQRSGSELGGTGSYKANGATFNITQAFN